MQKTLAKNAPAKIECKLMIMVSCSGALDRVDNMNSARPMRARRKPRTPRSVEEIAGNGFTVDVIDDSSVMRRKHPQARQDLGSRQNRCKGGSRALVATRRHVLEAQRSSFYGCVVITPCVARRTSNHRRRNSNRHRPTRRRMECVNHPRDTGKGSETP